MLTSITPHCTPFHLSRGLLINQIDCKTFIYLHKLYSLSFTREPGLYINLTLITVSSTTPLTYNYLVFSSSLLPNDYINYGGGSWYVSYLYRAVSSLPLLWLQYIYITGLWPGGVGRSEILTKIHLHLVHVAWNTTCTIIIQRAQNDYVILIHYTLHL